MDAKQLVLTLPCDVIVFLAQSNRYNVFEINRISLPTPVLDYDKPILNGSLNKTAHFIFDKPLQPGRNNIVWREKQHYILVDIFDRLKWVTCFSPNSFSNWRAEQGPQTCHNLGCLSMPVLLIEFLIMMRAFLPRGKQKVCFCDAVPLKC